MSILDGLELEESNMILEDNDEYGKEDLIELRDWLNEIIKRMGD